MSKEEIVKLLIYEQNRFYLQAEDYPDLAEKYIDKVITLKNILGRIVYKDDLPVSKDENGLYQWRSE